MVWFGGGLDVEMTPDLGEMDRGEVWARRGLDLVGRYMYDLMMQKVLKEAL